MRIGSRDKFKPNASGKYLIGAGTCESFDLFNLAAAYQFIPSLRVNRVLKTSWIKLITQVFLKFTVAGSTMWEEMGADLTFLLVIPLMNV